MYALIFSTIVLLLCWSYGDVTTRTKLIFTGMYVGSFGFLLVEDLAFLFTVTHCILIAVMGGLTFGWEWLSRGRY